MALTVRSDASGLPVHPNSRCGRRREKEKTMPNEISILCMLELAITTGILIAYNEEIARFLSDLIHHARRGS